MKKNESDNNGCKGCWWKLGPSLPPSRQEFKKRVWFFNFQILWYSDAPQTIIVHLERSYSVIFTLIGHCMYYVILQIWRHKISSSRTQA